MEEVVKGVGYTRKVRGWQAATNGSCMESGEEKGLDGWGTLLTGRGQNIFLHSCSCGSPMQKSGGFIRRGRYPRTPIFIFLAHLNRFQTRATNYILQWYHTFSAYHNVLSSDLHEVRLYFKWVHTLTLESSGKVSAICSSWRSHLRRNSNLFTRSQEIFLQFNSTDGQLNRLDLRSLKLSARFNSY